VVQVRGTTTAAILGEDRSFTAAMTGIFTVGLMHVLVSWLKLRSVTFERIADGTPIVLYDEGRWSEDEMRTLPIQEPTSGRRCARRALSR